MKTTNNVHTYMRNAILKVVCSRVLDGLDCLAASTSKLYNSYKIKKCAFL